MREPNLPAIVEPVVEAPLKNNVFTLFGITLDEAAFLDEVIPEATEKQIDAMLRYYENAA